MLTDFQNFVTVVFSITFATKSMSYISPHFKYVTPLPCKTQKTETGKILLHLNAITLVECHKINKYDRQNEINII